jgi:hypothetical protein
MRANFIIEKIAIIDIVTFPRLHQFLYRDSIDDLRIFSDNQGFDILSQVDIIALPKWVLLSC